MADYKIAISKVLLSEGYYSKDPDDNGGETYRGISRKFWAKSRIWPIIDFAKLLPNFPNSLSSNSALQDLVIEFYHENFWNMVGGSQIKSQEIANLLVDSAVNEGITPAIKRAQSIVSIAQTGRITNELLIKLNSMV